MGIRRTETAEAQEPMIVQSGYKGRSSRLQLLHFVDTAGDFLGANNKMEFKPKDQAAWPDRTAVYEVVKLLETHKKKGFENPCKFCAMDIVVVESTEELLARIGV